MLSWTFHKNGDDPTELLAVVTNLKEVSVTLYDITEGLLSSAVF